MKDGRRVLGVDVIDTYEHNLEDWQGLYLLTPDPFKASLRF